MQNQDRDLHKRFFRENIRVNKIMESVFRRIGSAAVLVAVTICAGLASAEQPQVVLDRGGSTVALEAYAPNIIRVTLNLQKDPALAPPGFGFFGTPSANGWSSQESDKNNTYRSSRLVVSVAKNFPGHPMPTQLDIAKFFNGSTPPAHITITTPEGKVLLDMTGGSMAVPNHKDGTASLLNDKRPSDR